MHYIECVSYVCLFVCLDLSLDLSLSLARALAWMEHVLVILLLLSCLILTLLPVLSVVSDLPLLTYKLLPPHHPVTLLLVVLSSTFTYNSDQSDSFISPSFWQTHDCAATILNSTCVWCVVNAVLSLVLYSARNATERPSCVMLAGT